MWHLQSHIRRLLDKQRRSFVPIQDDLSSFFTQCPSCVLRVVQESESFQKPLAQSVQVHFSEDHPARRDGTIRDLAPGKGLGSGQERVVRQQKIGENVGRQVLWSDEELQLLLATVDYRVSFFFLSPQLAFLGETPVCYVHKWAKCFIKLKSKNALDIREESTSSILFYWLCQDDVFYPTKLPD